MLYVTLAAWGPPLSTVAGIMSWVFDGRVGAGAHRPWPRCGKSCCRAWEAAMDLTAPGQSRARSFSALIPQKAEKKLDSSPRVQRNFLRLFICSLWRNSSWTTPVKQYQAVRSREYVIQTLKRIGESLGSRNVVDRNQNVVELAVGDIVSRQLSGQPFMSE